MDSQSFANLLATAVKSGASDIHLQVANAPAFRIRGDLKPVKLPPLTESDMAAILSSVIPEASAREKLATLRDYDGSFDVKGLARFRVNVNRNQGSLGIVMRVIPFIVPTIEQLGLPPVMNHIASLSRGLVLVTGATGSGKSSTLAALINHMNENQRIHILTIEDPIEFVHPPKSSRVTQREVGRDTDNFSHALRAALRQDPDVILVGEMRDQETIDIAIKAAETGHLVLSTVHTTDAVKTIGRLVAVFPPNEQKMVRMRLADNIAATISQRLVPRADGKGMVAGLEIMVNSAATAECINDEAMTAQLNDRIEKSYNQDGTGGQTFEQHLARLYFDQIVTLEKAKEYATNPSDFERNLLYGRSPQANNKLDSMPKVELDRPEPEPEPVPQEERSQIAIQRFEIASIDEPTDPGIEQKPAIKPVKPRAA